MKCPVQFLSCFDIIGDYDNLKPYWKWKQKNLFILLRPIKRNLISIMLDPVYSQTT